jgi:hypothetical protein
MELCGGYEAVCEVWCLWGDSPCPLALPRKEAKPRRLAVAKVDGLEAFR